MVYVEGSINYLEWVMNDIQWLIEVDGVIISIIAVCLLAFSHHRGIKAGRNLMMALALNGLVLLSDIFAIQFHGELASYAFVIVKVSNFTLYLFQQMLIIFMCRYVYEKIAAHDPTISKIWVHVEYALFLLVTIGLVSNPFTGLYYTIDEQNVYCRGPLFIIPMIVAGISIAIQVIQVFRHRDILDDKESLVMSTYFIFPAIGLIIQTIWYGYSWINIGITVSVVFVLAEYFTQQKKLKEEQEKTLMLSRAYLLISQIKPHFLFNALSVIQSLIEDEPDTAQIALSHLSKYLRKNMDLEANKSAVPIYEELNFLQNYVYIQQLRFGDKLQIRYEIDDSLEFSVPFLSIQPLVENAIVHGVRQKIEGGTVLIRTYEEEDAYIIQVIDDGAGFDMNANMDEKPRENTHHNGVGLKNVQERLRLISNGEFKMESTPGVGTTVTVRIPKEVEK